MYVYQKVWLFYFQMLFMRYESVCLYKNCILKFRVVMFVVVKNWIQFKCLFFGEWMDKLQQIYIMDYQLVIKRKWSIDLRSMDK